MSQTYYDLDNTAADINAALSELISAKVEDNDTKILIIKKDSNNKISILAQTVTAIAPEI